jgi:heat shock protein HtpX
MHTETNTFKTTLLLAAMTGLLLVVGQAVGGRGGMTFALVMAGVMNFAAWFWSDRIVLRAYRAVPVAPQEAPELFGIVQGLALSAGIPLPRIYVIPDPALNAFATGRSPRHAAVAVTEGLLRALDRAELEGVLAHELAHVLNRDTLTSTIAATLAGAISWVAHPFMLLRGGDDEGGSPLGALLGMILAPIVAFLIQMAVSRSREYGADGTGARLAGSPEGLARALRKLQAAAEQLPMHHADPATAHLFIVNPLSGRSIAGLFATHPPLEERIARLLGTYTHAGLRA